MGAGLALQIKRKYPEVYNQYKDIAHPNMRGKVQVVDTSNPKLKVANVFGQVGYGVIKQQTEYSLLESALNELSDLIGDEVVYFPKGIGCGLAGGDWEVVSGIISRIFHDAVIVDFGG